MSKTLQKFVKLFLITVLMTYGLLWVLHTSFLQNTIHLRVNNLFLFHLAVTLVILLQLYFINKKLHDQLGFVFLGMITLKLVLVGFYIAPHLLKKVVYTTDELALFAIPYFVFLTLEVYFTKLLLDKKIS